MPWDGFHPDVLANVPLGIATQVWELKCFMTPKLLCGASCPQRAARESKAWRSRARDDRSGTNFVARALGHRLRVRREQTRFARRQLWRSLRGPEPFPNFSMRLRISDKPSLRFFAPN